MSLDTVATTPGNLSWAKPEKGHDASASPSATTIAKPPEADSRLFKWLKKEERDAEMEKAQKDATGGMTHRLLAGCCLLCPCLRATFPAAQLRAPAAAPRALAGATGPEPGGKGHAGVPRLPAPCESVKGLTSLMVRTWDRKSHCQSCSCRASADDATPDAGAPRHCCEPTASERGHALNSTQVDKLLKNTVITGVSPRGGVSREMMGSVVGCCGCLCLAGEGGFCLP